MFTENSGVTKEVWHSLPTDEVIRRLEVVTSPLPQRDGMDIFDILKKDYPSLKVIVSSVYPIDEQEFLIWDADDYYYKTDDISVLMNKMAVLLKT